MAISKRILSPDEVENSTRASHTFAQNIREEEKVRALGTMTQAQYGAQAVA